MTVYLKQNPKHLSQEQRVPASLRGLERQEPKERGVSGTQERTSEVSAVTLSLVAGFAAPLEHYD